MTSKTICAGGRLLAALAIACGMSGVAIAQDDADVIEEITVRGIKASLQRSLDLKRDADSVVDAITAEDFGKFPDQNLAESLQRITGVSVSRAKGEGHRISVRGMGTGFNLTTINGVGVVSATSNISGRGGRDFAFDVLPSELISGLEVHKSPTADLNGGSVGALVNIKTAHPLDFDGRKIAGSIVTAYSELGSNTDPKASFLVSNSNDEKTFGVLFAVSYTERTIRADNYQGSGHLRISDSMAAEIGLTPAGADNPYAETRGVWGTVLNDRSRLGIAGSMQFHPSDDVEIIFDALHSKLEERGNAPAVLFNPASGGTNLSGTVEDGLLTSLSGDTSGGPTRVLVTNGNDQVQFPGDTTFQNYALTVDWGSSDKLDAQAKAYYTKSEYFYDFARYFAEFSPTSFDFELGANGDVPRLSIGGVDFSDPSDYAISNALGVPITQNEDEQGAQLDFDLHWDGGSLRSIEFGVQHKVRERDQNRGLLFTGLGGAPYAPELNFLSFPGDLLSSLDGASFPHDVVYADVGELVDVMAGGEIDFLTNQDAFYYVVKEAASVAYIKGNFENSIGDTPISGNIGLRFVRTDVTASGISQELIGIDPNNPDLPLFSEDAREITDKNSYDDLLWSLNLKADLRDDVLMRFSAARVMARPPVSRLAPALTNLNVNNRTIAWGNTQLDPYRANQFDVTLEWYLDDASAFSAGVFYKDLNSLVSIEGEQEEVVPGVIMTVTQPRNGKGAKVYGFEVAFQKQFDSGFGGLVNYTYTDSDAAFANPFVPGGIGLIGNSKNNLNLVGFYEKEGWSARLAYNYRSEFLEQEVGLAANPEYVDAYGQFDAQVSWEINDNFTAFVEGINIADEKVFRYNNNDKRMMRGLSSTGPRWFVGMRASF